MIFEADSISDKEWSMEWLSNIRSEEQISTLKLIVG